VNVTETRRRESRPDGALAASSIRSDAAALTTTPDAAQWKAFISSLVGPIALIASEGYELDVQVRDVGACLLLKVRSGGHKTIRSTAGAHLGLSVALQVDGVSRIEQAGAALSVEAGEMLLWRAGEGYTRTFEMVCTTILLHVPPSRLTVPVEIIRKQRARVIRADESLCSVLTALIQTAWDAPPLSPPAALRLGRAISETLSSLLWDLSGGGTYVRHRETVSEAIRHIQENLGDPGLDVAAVARHGHTSVRQLQKAFNALGTTVSGWIREERLQAASVLLANPAGDEPTIAEISRDCGFANHSHFSRLFGERFGATPVQWRAQSVKDQEQ
jgi:AraC-like DNA-binding protein